jgi:hypothetical protein
LDFGFWGSTVILSGFSLFLKKCYWKLFMVDRGCSIGILSGTIALMGLVSSAIAHNIVTDADVGATFHIEPNHNPHAGETARAWFALTRQGGTLIPLEQCDCKLAVYEQSAAEKSPILAPSLQAINAEQYRGIPGADIVFPKAGIYELELRGTSKVAGEFQPFRLTYTVTVAPGTRAATETAKETVSEGSKEIAPSPRGFGFRGVLIAIASVLLLSLGGLGLLQQRSKSKINNR